MTNFNKEISCQKVGVAPSFIDIDQAPLIDWFSQLLIQPLDEQVIKSYTIEPMSNFFVDLGEELLCQDLTNSIYQQLTEDNAKQIQDKLNWSYMLLFEGVSGPRNISLYESGYVGDGSRLFQQPFIDMQAILQQLDFAVSPNCKEPSDHISIELAAFAEAIRQNNVEISNALHQRLIQWIPKLSIAVGEIQFKGFYHNILLLLEVYLMSFYRPSTECSSAHMPS